jgi:hypothetical protein
MPSWEHDDAQIIEWMLMDDDDANDGERTNDEKIEVLCTNVFEHRSTVFTVQYTKYCHINDPTSFRTEVR